MDKSIHLFRLLKILINGKRTEFALENERLLLQILMDSTFDSVYFKDIENRFIGLIKAHWINLG
jgi:hypothetical protein